jgi:hypothetical protein
MDAAGCTSLLFATDNVFVSHPGDVCKTPTLAFIFVFVALVICKFFVNGMAWRLWFARQKAGARLREFRNRLPIVPVLSAILCCLYLLLFLLTVTNVANASNGGATALYSIMFSIWGVSGLLLVKKLVRLGRRLIPLARSPSVLLQVQSMSSTVPPEAFENRLRLLDTFDSVMKVVVFIQLSLLLVASVIACTIGLIDPQGVWSRIVFGLIGCFGSMLFLLLHYHLERIVQAASFFLSSIDTSRRNDEVTGIERLIRNMRMSQLLWFSTGTAMAIPHLLIAANILPPHWYIVVLMLSVETLASTYAFYTSKPRFKRRPDSPERERAPLVAMELPGNALVDDVKVGLTPMVSSSAKIET